MFGTRRPETLCSHCALPHQACAQITADASRAMYLIREALKTTQQQDMIVFKVIQDALINYYVTAKRTG